MRSPADCLIFFRVQAGRLGRRSGFLGGLGGASLRGYRRALWTFLRDMPRGATKETKILVHATLTFLRHQFPVFPELGGKVGNELPRFGVLPLLWDELGGFLCRECDEPLDLVSVLEESDFSDLCVEVVVVFVSRETSVRRSQYRTSMACAVFRRLGRVISLS